MLFFRKFKDFVIRKKQHKVAYRLGKIFFSFIVQIDFEHPSSFTYILHKIFNFLRRKPQSYFCAKLIVFFFYKTKNSNTWLLHQISLIPCSILIFLPQLKYKTQQSLLTFSICKKLLDLNSSMIWLYNILMTVLVLSEWKCQFSYHSLIYLYYRKQLEILSKNSGSLTTKLKNWRV